MTPTAVSSPSIRLCSRLAVPPARLVFLEFNELCRGFLEQFMADGRLPHFRRLHDQSTVFTTDAGEAPTHLEPWIQWPTVHTGLPFAEHQAYHLGDGRRMNARGVAEVLSDAGVPVGVCGSMNQNYGRLRGYVLPDPWDQAGAAWPADLTAYSGPVGRLVRESSRHSTSKADLVRLGWFLARNGLSPRTMKLVLAQLLNECLDRGVSWRRACVLDRLQYDVFRSLNRRFGVRFATFFCNSTAHFQHYFWRHFEPGRFAVPPPKTDHSSLAEAIPYGYRMMDQLIGRVLRDHPHDVIVLCTALSQQPWTETTKCTYRPHRFADLLGFAGLTYPAEAVRPVMAEQFHLDCGTVEAAEVAESALRGLQVDGEPLLAVRRESDGLFVGCRITTAAVEDRLVRRTTTGEERRFGNLFYRLHTLRSGRHHPDGVLWWRTGKHRVEGGRVPLTAVAPTLLRHFGVEPPKAMRTPPLDVEPTLPQAA